MRKALRKLYYKLPAEFRFLARKIYYLPIDLVDGLLNKRHKYQPKRGDVFIGSGDFIAQGEHQLELLIKHIDIKSDDAVLDIGCGIGRTAVALTQYLNNEAIYEGFDVVEKGVKWCNNHIHKDFSNFNFKYVPLSNDLYNTSTEKADQFIFPYADSSFDKVFLFSVFTHMQVSEIGHYFNEIYRVLKKDGKCLTTIFFYDDDTELFARTNSDFSFSIAKDGYRLMDDKVKSANIALSESLLKNLVEKSNLTFEKLLHGYWKGISYKTDENSYQDLLVVSKK